MVVLNKIYTRTGDDGSTALGTGERRQKNDLRVAAYGTVDEANAAIGVAIVHIEDGKLSASLARIQNDLFDLGADLATPAGTKDFEYEPLRISEAQVIRLERDIDRFNADLSPLRTFVLPGGSTAAAALHVARTVTRRAERHMVALAASKDEIVSDQALRYANRASDFLFVAARWVNDHGQTDRLWVPGENR